MMYCFISDIHNNLEALETVVDDSKKFDIDEYICLGDIVGYGPLPNECIETVKNICRISIAGNHDYAVLDKINLKLFNEYAGKSVFYSKKLIDKKYIEYLNNLKEKETFDNFYIVHGSLTDHISGYISNTFAAKRNFEVLDKNICFYGHTHIPCIYTDSDKQTGLIKFEEGKKIKLKNNYRYLINTGSVGQPRDGSPKAGYIIYDSAKNTVECIRTEYNIRKTQRFMKKAGLPDYLIVRLNSGN